MVSIGENAFEYAGLTEINIPKSVTEMGEGAFRGCKELSKVTIEDGATYIGPYAFENCTSLESVTIPSSMTYIGLRAFKDTGLQTAYFAEADGWKKFRLSGNNLINPISVDPSALSDPAQAAAELKDFPDTGFGAAYVWQR